MAVWVGGSREGKGEKRAEEECGESMWRRACGKKLWRGCA